MSRWLRFVAVVGGSCATALRVFNKIKKSKTFWSKKEIATAGTVEQQSFSDTRRILRGTPSGITRPYMVYLRPLDRIKIFDTTWTCGGVIIHHNYILTSAACIEDVQQFLVIAGSQLWVPNDQTSECIEYGGLKAVSKCIPKDFVFDGHEFDNTKWMRDDIAMVKLESSFNFEKRVRGCDYIPELIRINNISFSMEAPGTIASVAGWGSVTVFDSTRTANNSQYLLEIGVKLISTSRCKSLWPARYHHIIDYKIICSQDSSSDISLQCGETNCAENPEFDLVTRRRSQPSEPVDFEALHMQNSHKNSNDTRRAFVSGGGFCHNDHGGPLVVGHGKNAVVVGIISACQHNTLNHRCYGPFLYTSVWKNKHLINCVLGDITCELEKWMTCCSLEEEQLL